MGTYVIYRRQRKEREKRRNKMHKKAIKNQWINKMKLLLFNAHAQQMRLQLHICSY